MPPDQNNQTTDQSSPQLNVDGAYPPVAQNMQQPQTNPAQTAPQQETGFHDLVAQAGTDNQQPQQLLSSPPQQNQQIPTQQPQVGGEAGNAAAAQAMAQASSNPNSTQNTLEISEIRDGIMIMADGSYRAVIFTESINFDLMSPKEREGVEQAYQSFINSLYFPVQIYIRSQKIDMRPYLEKLSGLRDSQDNMLLAMMMDDYIIFINQLVQQANIMDKKFYIVIPFEPPVNAKKVVKSGKKFFGNVFGSSRQVVTINEADLEQAKTELGNRVQSAMNSLVQMGLQAVPLDTQELIELFYLAYNPDTAPRQRLAPMQDLETPLVTRGDGEASQPHLDQAGF